MYTKGSLSSEIKYKVKEFIVNLKEFLSLFT
jgi:hypothetical protein